MDLAENVTFADSSGVVALSSFKSRGVAFKIVTVCEEQLKSL